MAGSEAFINNLKTQPKYDPISENTTYTPSLADTYEEVYSVTGAGFLSSAFIKSETAQPNYLKITADGVVVFSGACSGTGEGGGVLNQSAIAFDDTDNSMFAKQLYTDGRFSAASVTSHPYTSATPADDAVVILSQPIYFTTSLLVEMKEDTNTNAITYFLDGGVF